MAPAGRPARVGDAASLLAVGLLALVVLAPVASAQSPEGPLQAQLDAFRDSIQGGVENYTAAYEDYEAAENASARDQARERMADAGHRIGDAFLSFERGHGAEGSLSVFMQTQMGQGFYRSFERDVVLLRATMVDAKTGVPASPAEVQAGASPVFKSLERAEGCLPEGCGSTWAGAAAQSFLVLLREGFEAILLVGAIVTYLHKTDRGEKQREVWAGVGAGVGASLLAWFALNAVFSAAASRGSAAHAIMEGVTMLLAAVVLFYVSFWLLSKVEANRWQAFIEGKVEASLADDRSWMLALVGFLAVFREGVETALFVQAIGVGSGGAWDQILLGLGVGAVALVALYYGVHHAGVRVPLRSFFAVTGAALGFLAVRFLGLGLFELQEAQWLATTPLSEMASYLGGRPVLGSFLRDIVGTAPTLEVVGGQLLLVGVFVAAGVWAVVSTPPEPDPAGG